MTQPFSKTPKWLAVSGLSSQAVHLYLAILNYADKDGRAFPSRQTLADDMGKKSVRSIASSLDELKRVGAITISHRYSSGKTGRRSSYYTLTFETPAQLDAKGKKSAPKPSNTKGQNSAPKPQGNQGVYRQDSAPTVGQYSAFKPGQNSAPLTRPTFNETHVELITGANATGTVEPVEVEPPEPGTAEALIAEWRQSRTNRPPNRVVEQLSKQIEKLLDEGFDYDRVRQAVGQWQQRGLSPSTLPSILDSIQNGQNQHENASAAERRLTAGQERDKALAERTVANQTPLDPFALEVHQRRPQKQLGNGDAAA